MSIGVDVRQCVRAAFEIARARLYGSADTRADEDIDTSKR